MMRSTCGVFLVVIITVLCSNNVEAKLKMKKKEGGECDLYEGRWVYDNNYPLYNPKQCPFLLQQFDCVRNGRADREYLKYRWQPRNCDSPRWNGREMSRRIRNKKVLFVGDSLSLNQWQSLACMLHSASPRANYTLTRNGFISTFSIPSKQVTVSFLRNALLVDIVKQKSKRVLKLGSVEVAAKLWTGYDILIFDTWHWWLHTGRKQPWDVIQDGNDMHQDMDRLKAYEKALLTWSRWVSNNINFNRVQVFFQGISPDHGNATQWGRTNVYNMQCRGEQKPIQKLRYFGGADQADMTLDQVLGKTGKPIHLLRFTKMSQYRVDGHPSIYGNPRHKGMDCTHWCLPGVPDTWNLLLYATLIRVVN